MKRDLLVTDIRFHRASTGCRAHGLLGWVNFILDGRIHVDGVKVSRTLDGSIVLAIPAQQDNASSHCPDSLPLTPAACLAIEHEVIAYLRARGHVS